MAWRFRKSVKIIPGVRLNFSSRGVSTSIGVRGAGLNFSNRGVYAYASIPGTGLSYRERIGGGRTPARKNQLTNTNEHYLPDTLVPREFGYQELPDNIISLDVQEITSQDMQGIKDLILGTHEQRTSIQDSIPGVKRAIIWSKVKIALSYVFLVSLIKKAIAQEMKEDLESQKEVLAALEEQLEESVVRLEIEFDDSIKTKYDRMVEGFRKLTTSEKIWDVTGEYWEDRVKTRSAASTLVKRQQVRIGMKHLSDIRSDYEPLYFQNANGADLYIYPNFMVAYKGKVEFAVIGYDELNFVFSSVRFVETERVPSDSRIIDTTWAKVNKNGSRDRRFKDNYQIPIVCYAELQLATSTGLREAYQFSNYENAQAFSSALSDYQQTIKKLKAIKEK
ncbi:DUF4236 domain-containing protein [Salmonirosea aquatica]|uniref:DUF4236 domain-containing protein n=1 Tax=Salmonirosea aquatica TaxID=2654236 RepID=A0A7C9F5T2_9BACT|nr:DUF4236 domain-containing protein [Cytophagaceae bacterium SJW1-29]